MTRVALSYAQKACVKGAGKAMQQMRMIGPGARIGVAVSGGVDSWVLLEVLRHRQRIVPFPFEIMPLHINAGFDAENHAPLLDYVKEHGLSCHIALTDHGLKGHSDENLTKSPCFLCARLRRTALFMLCKKYKLSHLAFGHTADDLVTNFFMNLVQNGRVEGLSPNEAFFGGELMVIRPLILMEKKDIQRAARQWQLPVWKNPCPSSDKSKRAHYTNKVKELHEGKAMQHNNIFNGLRRWQMQETLNKLGDNLE